MVPTVAFLTGCFMAVCTTEVPVPVEATVEVPVEVPMRVEVPVKQEASETAVAFCDSWDRIRRRQDRDPSVFEIFLAEILEIEETNTLSEDENDWFAGIEPRSFRRLLRLSLLVEVWGESLTSVEIDGVGRNETLAATAKPHITWLVSHFCDEMLIPQS